MDDDFLSSFGRQRHDRIRKVQAIGECYLYHGRNGTHYIYRYAGMAMEGHAPPV